MSAFEGKADVNHEMGKSPLIARSEHHGRLKRAAVNRLCALKTATNGGKADVTGNALWVLVRDGLPRKHQICETALSGKLGKPADISPIDVLLRGMKSLASEKWSTLIWLWKVSPRRRIQRRTSDDFKDTDISEHHGGNSDDTRLHERGCRVHRRTIIGAKLNPDGSCEVVRAATRTCATARAGCPLWVTSGHLSTTLRMSAFGGKADVNHTSPECPLIAISGSSRCLYMWFTTERVPWAA